MSTIAVIVAGGLAGLAVLNVVLAVLVERRLRRPTLPLLSDAEAPEGLVLLCLRGGDPFLERSLRRLFDQDYPRYRVRIVLDSAADSARQYVDAVLRDMQPKHVEVVTLGERFKTCTYKMSGILSGTQSLPAGTAFVALMDGDTVPHRTWLRELATPIVRGGALCTTGNRWYFPEHPTLGSMVRVCWGAGALVMMALQRIPWGGTMAVRRDVIEDPRLRARIQHAFSEDTTIGQFVEEIGGRVEFDPRLMIVNQETTGLRGFFGFDTRQLLAAKMQHRAWKWIALYGLSGAAMLLYPLARLGGFAANWWTDLAYEVYFLSYASQAILFGPAVRAMLRGRGESLPNWGLRRTLMGLLAVPIAQLTHLLALAKAFTMRKVVWRGVHYKLGGNPPLVVEHDDSPAPTMPIVAPEPLQLARSA
jgi:hypothetical protein